MNVRRTITLHDEPGAPTIEALCDDRGWNGFHVPFLTAAELISYFDRCRQFDADRAVSGLVWGDDE